MKDKLASLRFILLAVLGWSAGAMFAAVWMWLMGLQLSRFQAQLLVCVFAVLGLVFGIVQVLRGRTDDGVQERDPG